MTLFRNARRRPRTGLCLAFAVAWLLSAHAKALTWQHANSADANTLALYHFNERSGTTAADELGLRPLTHVASNMPSATAPTWLALPSGRYLVCASNAYALWNTLDVSIDWTKGLTVSFWLRATNTGSRSICMLDISRGDGWQNINRFEVRTGWSNPYRPFIHDTSLMFDTTPALNAKLLDDQWHHVALTWNPADTTARCYLDNVCITNWPAAGGDGLTLPCKICVGAKVQDAASYFAGGIDELLMHNGVLSDFSDGYGFGPTNPILAVLPTQVDIGSSQSAGTYQIANAGVGTLSWTNHVVAGTNWLAVTPAYGTQSGVVTVSVDRTGLAYGAYTGSIAVTANGEITQELVHVHMAYAAPQLARTPSLLDFGGGSATQAVTLWNAGAGTVAWTAAPQDAWLHVEPAGGVASNTPYAVAVWLERAGLPAYSIITSQVAFVPTVGVAQTVTVVVSTYPLVGTALLQFRITRPGSTTDTCVRAIIRTATGAVLAADEWTPSTWPVVDMRGIAVAPDMLVTVPVGQTVITLGKGPDYYPTSLVVNTVIPGQLYTVALALEPVFDLYQRGWRAGEIHDHYFHGEGEIFRTPAQVWRFCAAGGLDFLSMGEDHYLAAISNRAAMQAAWTPFDATECMLWNGTEAPKNFWGHYCTIALDPWSVRGVPPYYQGLYDIHAQGGVAFPNHPLRFYPGRIWVSGGGATTWFFYANNNHFKEYPLDALVGHTMDAYSGCSDVASGSTILPAYFALLERGLRIPFATDSDLCFDRRSNGMRAPGCWTLYYYLGSNTLCRAALADAMRKGRLMATTGPLVLFTIDAARPGDTLPADGATRTLRIEAAYPFNPWQLTYRNFASNQPCRVAQIDLYRNGALLQSWTPNTPSADVTRVINETTPGSYYMVRVLGNDGIWQAGYASPIYFDAAPRPPHPATWQTTVQGKLYDASSGAALTGTVACLRYGQEYWRIATDAQGLFQARVPVDATLVARDDRGRALAQDILRHEPVYRFLSYLSDTNYVTGSAYVPQSITDLSGLISTMRWEFPLGYNLAAAFVLTNLSGNASFANFSVLAAPPPMPGETNTEIALIMLDKTQVQGGDALQYACLFRQPLGAAPTESLSVEAYGWNPDYPSAYNAYRFIGGQWDSGSLSNLGGGFYLRTGTIAIPTWVSNIASTVAGIDLRARVRDTSGSLTWREEMHLKVPIGPTRRHLLVNTVWDGLPGSWGDYGIGPCTFYRAHTQFLNRYPDYRTLRLSFTLDGQPITLCPNNVAAHCADADDAVFYEQFYYDGQCEPQYRNVPMRDAVRPQPPWPEFAGVPVFSTDADPVAPVAVAMEPRDDRRFATNAIVQLFWHLEDVGTGAANATIIVDDVPVVAHTTENPIRLYPPLAAGHHRWHVIGWDRAGNCATSSVATFFIDIPEPLASGSLVLLLAAGGCRRRTPQRACTCRVQASPRPIACKGTTGARAFMEWIHPQNGRPCQTHVRPSAMRQACNT